MRSATKNNHRMRCCGGVGYMNGGGSGKDTLSGISRQAYQGTLLTLFFSEPISRSFTHQLKSSALRWHNGAMPLISRSSLQSRSNKCSNFGALLKPTSDTIGHEDRSRNRKRENMTEVRR